MTRVRRHEIMPGTGVEATAFWAALAHIVRDLEPHNHELLRARDALQSRIDEWHLARQGKLHDAAEYVTGYVPSHKGRGRPGTG